MNRVPSAFSDRVAALWKCCDGLFCHECANQRKTPDCAWTRISKKLRIVFYIGSEKGKWIYRFRDLEESNDTYRYMTMAELKSTASNLRNVVISRIVVFENSAFRTSTTNLKPLDVDMEVLMKFVTFLSNELFSPRLAVESASAQLFASADGAKLFQVLQNMHFTNISIALYHDCYNSLLQRQYSRRKTTRIEVNVINSGGEFLESELAAIRLRNCYFHCEIAINVANAIVTRFLEDPSQFGVHYDTLFGFKYDEMKSLLRGYAEKNQCINEADVKFTFRGSNGRVLIVHHCHGCWWSFCANAKCVL